MKRRFLACTTLAAAVALTACGDSVSPNQIVSDQELTADIAAAGGEAIANEIADLIGNESAANMPAPPAFDLFGSPPGVTVTRDVDCFDAQGALQQQCNATTTASVSIAVTKNGSFTRSHQGPRGTETFTAAVHQARLLNITGLAGNETSRTHNGNGTSRDTATVVGTHEAVTLTRVIAEASDDTVAGIVFALPHSSNPWPTAGQVIRNSSGTVSVTATGGAAGERSETRSFDRRVVVTFPADAQGNVPILINDKTCNLNLVTRRITNCT